MAKDRNRKDIDIGDEVVVVFRITEVLPASSDLAVIDAETVHGQSKFFVRFASDQVILQRKAKKDG